MLRNSQLSGGGASRPCSVRTWGTSSVTNTILGAEGDDVIRGEGLRDAIFGLGGNDELELAGPGGEAHGGPGDDLLISGGAYRDFLWGDEGADELQLNGMVYAFGGDGDDLFRFSPGASALVAGGDGVDVLVLEGERADYTLRGGSLRLGGGEIARVTGVEILRFADGDALAADLDPASISRETTPGGALLLSVEGGAATLRGSRQGDGFGGRDADVTVLAGAGNDYVNLMGAGSHRVRAGAGDDRIDARGWDVSIAAGRGADEIRGGFGLQTIDGGGGRDVVRYDGDRADYLIEVLGAGQARIARTPTAADGIVHQWDLVARVETLRFADGDLALTGVPVPDAESFAMTEGGTLVLDPAELLDGDVDPLGGTPTLAGVSGAAGGAVAIVDGRVVFTPLPGFHGDAGFDYAVQGLGGVATQHVTVTVASSNRAPQAADDAFAGIAGGRVAGDLMAANGAGADLDPDGDALRVVNVAGAAVAADGATRVNLGDGVVLKVRADGGVIWILDDAFLSLGAEESRAVSVTYVVADPEGAIDAARATLTVTGAPDLRLVGTADADRLAGAAGDDVLFGRGEADRLSGRAGDDRLFGGAGADRIEGGTGDDALSGGRGPDLFVFHPGDGSDVVVDFDPAHDRIAIRGLPDGASITTVDDGADLLILGPDLTIRVLGAAGGLELDGFSIGGAWLA